MEIAKSDIVRSDAGRDQGKLFIVLAVEGEYLLLELYLVSPELEEHELATRQLQVYADGVPLEQGDQVYSQWLPYNGFAPQGQIWVPLVGLDCGPEVAWREEGYRARVHMPFTYRLPEDRPTQLTYKLLDLEGGGSHTGTLTLTPALWSARTGGSCRCTPTGRRTTRASC